MRITSRDGTIRVEDKTGSASWPLYMAIPAQIRSALMKQVAAKLKIAHAGDPSIEFEVRDGRVHVDGKEVNPKSIPPHAKAVCDVVYAHDNGIFIEIHALRQLKNVPAKQITEKKPVSWEEIKVIDGKAVITQAEEERDVPLFDEMELVNENGDTVFNKPVQAVGKNGERMFEQPAPEDYMDGRLKPGYQPRPVMAPALPAIHREPRMTEAVEVSRADKDRLVFLEGKINQ